MKNDKKHMIIKDIKRLFVVIIFLTAQVLYLHAKLNHIIFACFLSVTRLYTYKQGIYLRLLS